MIDSVSSIQQITSSFGESLSPKVNMKTVDENQGNTSHDPLTQTGKFGAITNYLNTILGAGIIGIPYAIKECGCVAGVILLIFVALLTEKSLRLIVEVASNHPMLGKKQVTTFEELMSYTFGNYGRSFILWCMFVIAYGSMVAYLLVIKDTIPIIFKMIGMEIEYKGHYEGENAFIDKDFIMMITSACIMLPLSMLRDLSTLAITSFLSIFAAIATVCLTIKISPITEFDQESSELFIKSSSFVGLSILSDAFACHHAAYIVYGSLRKPTKRRWGIVTFSTIFLAAIIFLLFGLAGFLGYGEDTQANILNNFEEDDLYANVARSLLTLTFLFTYPMECVVARHVLFAILFGDDADLEMDGPCCCIWRYFITFIIYVMTLVPALLFVDIGPVLALTGAIGASCLAYITPGILYLGVFGDEFLAYSSELISDDKNIIVDDQGIINLEKLKIPLEGEKNCMIKLNRATKPWWWYPLLFPIWCRIAQVGRAGLCKKIPKLTFETIEKQQQPKKDPIDRVVGCYAQETLCNAGFYEIFPKHNSDNNDTNSNIHQQKDIIQASKREFGIAIFYIIFGCVAMIGGLYETVVSILQD